MVDPLGLSAVRLTLGAEKIRNDSWCIAQDIALSSSRSQLPDILQEEISAAQQSRISDISQCRRESRHGLALGLPRATVSGKLNSCEIDVVQEYNDRVEELLQRNASRHANIDNDLKGILTGCLMPSAADVPVPSRSPNHR
ncbi:hypothetical protein P4544_05455 [Halomonas sp. LY9]